MFRMTIPPFPENCADCGRKMDGRMGEENPYGFWSVPTMNGATGKTTCSYCHQKSEGKDPQQYLKPGCEALNQLARWLAQGGK